MNRAETYSKSAEHVSTKLYSITISKAVACAINFDEKELRESYVGTANVSRLRYGYRVTGTLDNLRTLAFHMTREGGWDLPPSTIYACNQASKKLRQFIVDALRQEMAHTITCIENGALKAVVSCSCGWSCDRDTSKLAREAHTEHAVKAQGAQS